MSDEKKQILKKVEEGKLTAEEALILLESLEKNHSTSLSTNVNMDQSQFKQKTEQIHSMKQKVTKFLGSAFQKIKDVDLDFNFGPSFEVDHIFHHKDVELNALDLDVANGEIKIVPWDERDVRIECRAKVYKESDSEQAKTTFFENVYFKIEDNKMKFSIQKKQIKLHTVLYVPKQKYESINIRMFNGHITGEKMDVQKFKAKTANGKILLERIRSEDIELESVIGQIKLENATSKKLEAETLNGAILVQGSFEKVDTQSFNGGITFDLEDESCHTAFLKTKAGNIEIIVPEDIEVDGEFKSNIGKFAVDLPNKQIISQKKDVVQKELQFISNKGLAQRLHLEAEAKTGSVLIKNKED